MRAHYSRPHDDARPDRRLLVYPDAPLDEISVAVRPVRIMLHAVKSNPVQLQKVDRIPGVAAPAADRNDLKGPSLAAELRCNRGQVYFVFAVRAPCDPTGGPDRAGPEDPYAGHAEICSLGMQLGEVEHRL